MRPMAGKCAGLPVCWRAGVFVSNGAITEILQKFAMHEIPASPTQVHESAIIDLCKTFGMRHNTKIHIAHKNITHIYINV